MSRPKKRTLWGVWVIRSAAATMNQPRGKTNSPSPYSFAVAIFNSLQSASLGNSKPGSIDAAFANAGNDNRLSNLSAACQPVTGTAELPDWPHNVVRSKFLP